LRVVVCDTGPILHLKEAEALELLEKTGEVLVPPAVNRELETRISNWSNDRPSWVQIAQLPDEASRQAERWGTIGGLGLGEAEAIALARSIQADWLLTDDTSARVVGSLLGLEAHGSLGVILWGAANRYLERGKALSILERLARSSLWISPRILADARQALEQLFQ
jgi:predicted nucleic acid-binding protein